MTDYDDLFEMVRGGSTIAAAARQLGINVTTAQLACKVAGVKSSHGQMRKSPAVQQAVQYSVDNPDLTLRHIAEKFEICPKMLSQARLEVGIPSKYEAAAKKWAKFDWACARRLHSKMPLAMAARKMGIPAHTLRRKAKEMGWKPYNQWSIKPESPRSELSLYFDKDKWPRPPGLKEHLAELS